MGSPGEVNPRRKSQTKFVTKVGTLKPMRRTSDVKPSELGMPMSSIRDAIMLVKKKKWLESGNREADFDGGETVGSEANYSSERADRTEGRDRDRDRGADPGPDPNSPRSYGRGSNSPSQSDGYRSHNSPKQNSTSDSKGGSPRGDSSSPSDPAPKRGIARYTTHSAANGQSLTLLDTSLLSIEYSSELSVPTPCISNLLAKYIPQSFCICHSQEIFNV